MPVSAETKRRLSTHEKTQPTYIVKFLCNTKTRKLPLPYNSQHGQWRNHPGNQFNKDQGGPSNRPQQQGPSLYDRTIKLEENLA